MAHWKREPGKPLGFFGPEQLALNPPPRKAEKSASPTKEEGKREVQEKAE